MASLAARCHADVAIYSDGLNGAWRDSSWGRIQRDLNRADFVRSGSSAITVDYTGGWSGFELRSRKAIDVSGQSALRFFIHGGSGGQRIEVRCGREGGRYVSQTVVPVAAEWSEVTISLADLGPRRSIDYVLWFSLTPDPQRRFYVDDVSFVGTPSTNQPVVAKSIGGAHRLRVNANSERGRISPAIYGMNLADEDLAKQLRIPLRRWGGNAATRYNWQNNASNRGEDWYFENLPFDEGGATQLPHGSTTDRFVEQDRRTGAATLLTIPMIGWTAKSRTRACGFGIAKYGKQARVDPWATTCGDGITPAGLKITHNDPTDTSMPIDPSFVQSWVKHLVGKYGTAANGGVQLYGLDNEPMLWSQTHRDVHAAPTTYDELRDRSFAYASAIKAIDPSAKTLGPVAWGWNEYFWSALDQASGSDWKRYPQDRLAHGNTPLVEWYLQQMRNYERQHGVRILDYLDVHYYPEANGVKLGTAGGSATQALRLRSTRSLWDPTYTDESWIAQPVQLIPRMRDWVRRNYPGTKLAISEYNFGGLEEMNGALAQADVLGIFGREGVDLATLWNPPKAQMPGAFAFQMYRNYDGKGGEFGDISVETSTADSDAIAIHAAKRSSDGALTIMVINKRSTPAQASIALDGFTAFPSADLYRYSAQNLWAVQHEANVKIDGSALSASLPASSISLFVVTPSMGERYAAANTSVSGWPVAGR